MSTTSLLLTVGAYSALVAAILAAIIGLRNHKDIQEVHVLVNSQLDAIQQRLENMTGERDALQSEKDQLDKP